MALSAATKKRTGLPDLSDEPILNLKNKKEDKNLSDNQSEETQKDENVNNEN